MTVESDYVRLGVSNEEDGQPQKPQRRSLWRHWKMLSRFQRNLVTMVLVAVVVTLVYYWGLKEQVQLEEKKEELMNPQIHQPLPQHLDLEDSQIIQTESTTTKVVVTFTPFLPVTEVITMIVTETINPLLQVTEGTTVYMTETVNPLLLVSEGTTVNVTETVSSFLPVTEETTVNVTETVNPLLPVTDIPSVQFIPVPDWSIINRPDLKPIDEWLKEEEEEQRLNDRRIWEEERRKLEEKKREAKKKVQERIIVEQLRKLDERRREEEKKVIEETNKKREDKLKMKMEEKKVEAYEMFAEEWREVERIKEERRKEDERLIKEEIERKKRLERGEIVEKVTSKPGNGLVEGRAWSPEELTLKEEEEKAKLEEERRREQEERIREEQEERIREEQRKREEERQRELERRKKEEEKRKEEERQRELDRLREVERKHQEEIEAEEKKKMEEKRRELVRMTMVADATNIHNFRLKPVEFPPPKTERQIAVLDMLKHAWAGYKKYAWGHDHLKPISQTYHDWFGLGLTIVDGLDTLWIMGMKKEFNDSQEWVTNRLSVSFNEFHDVNLFEVTIRVLGGLLSAYHLSGDPVFLERAMTLGERLMPCFTKSPSAIPYSDVNLASRLAHSPKWSPDSSTSEVTTLQLEFRDLSRCCHDYTFEDVSFQVSEHVHVLEKTDGLVPIFINPNTGSFHENTEIKLGARGDSYYEYLLKQWIQTGKTHDFLKDDYLKAIEGIKKKLVKRTPKKDLVFIGELRGNGREFVPKMDHLVCFAPGMLALGVHHGMPEDHMKLAVDLMETCYRTYAERPTFLAPEITFFNYKPSLDDSQPDMYVKTNDAHNLLRPEFLESLWYMWSLTGNTTYQDWGWQIFKAFERYAKVNNGYTSLGNVNNPLDTRPRDMMESFFLSETIKYLYLLFSDDRKLIDVDKWVMNTEGHPLPIYTS
ncbi:endoplasmic reticulum mannosyl-oligosaccharide 1,2-alpha-mannosidase-like isoform X3 [Homalodisca vitripennis]|uniref:endoplasmic reticulum mannosyl-oligosaccharide 1,2-alpha-mannosidase-like isoform X3 n=1 Tax=Homalodisca vitripennis TaxID=197043 RepID=UPI001EEB0981|nr:endoplasmic reticulum mannosyl-oligosaccharide 1,2-alpha-mannosidase-like isoform X3 [Homalodisca vitripennis]